MSQGDFVNAAHDETQEAGKGLQTDERMEDAGVSGHSRILVKSLLYSFRIFGRFDWLYAIAEEVFPAPNLVFIRFFFLASQCGPR